MAKQQGWDYTQPGTITPYVAHIVDLLPAPYVAKLGELAVKGVGYKGMNKGEVRIELVRWVASGSHHGNLANSDTNAHKVARMTQLIEHADALYEEYATFLEQKARIARQHACELQVKQIE